MKTSAKFTGARQVPYRFPGARRKFNLYHKRVSMVKYTSIFLSKKTVIFLPVGINVFEIIKNTVN